MDCDVEAPNAGLFIQGETLDKWEHAVFAPAIDADRCTGCGACARLCQFKALVALPGRVMAFSELCHGCKGCQLICPEQAVQDGQRLTGSLSLRRDGKLTLLEGRLRIGEAMAPPLIEALREQQPDRAPAVLRLIDSPPGTSCPAITALRGVDYVILVTEPTPFGLHDLSLAVQMVAALGLPAGVIINRAGEGMDIARETIAGLALPILAELPDSRAAAEGCAQGQLLIDALPETGPLLQSAWDAVAQTLSAEEAA